MKLSSKNTFKPAPEGVFDAVCVDCVDLGEVDSPWGKKPKLRLVWEISEKMEDGKPFLVSQMYTASIGKKAKLRAILKTWRGRDFTDAELEDFEIDQVIGAPCQLVITHNDHEGTTYANTQSVLKAGKSKLSSYGKYKRVKDREGYEDPRTKKPEVQEHPEVEEQQDPNVPF